jgi:DNA polymerase-3 subunit gamma/tau
MAAAASEDEGTAPARAAQFGLALYRKYRPATFAEVKGQDHVTGPLRQALTTGRINHAYLFSGPRGCGKTSSARILARSLNCVKGPTPEPCGVCDSCVALAPGGPGSIDVIEIDAASHGGVDDARELRERAFYTPVSGRFKIYIIDEAHMVTQQGFNALLKLVEEPPPHLKFIFATTEPEKVIPTIRSRTHHYPFRLVPPSVLRELLQDILRKEGVAVEEAVLPLVVRAGGGSVRDSESILDQLLAGSDETGLTYERAVALLGFTDASLLDEIADGFAAGDGATVFRVVNRVIEGGHEPRRFAADMLDRFRDLIVLAAVPDAAQIGLLDLAPDRAERMAAQAEKFGQAGLTRAAEIISTGLDQMRGATSPRLLLELMCAQVLLPGAATDEKSLLARLERLESAAGGTSALRPQSPPRAPHPGQDHDAERSGVAPSGQQRAPRPAPRPQPAPTPKSEPAVRPEPAARTETPGRPESAARPAPRSERAPTSEPAPRSEPATTSESAGRSQSASSPAASASAGARGSAAPAPAASAGLSPVDSLRQNWAAVLETVKRERRVASILLADATVLSLEDGTLTLQFARAGNLKGFTTGSYDADQTRVLRSGFGLNVMVKGLVGGNPEPGGTGLAPASPGLGSAGPGLAGPGLAGPGLAGPGRGRQPAADPPPAGPAAAEYYDEPPDELPPDEDDMPPDEPSSHRAPARTTELTGMDLIQRELGGQVIGEIEG